MARKAQYEVIVHPAGLLDADEAGYWTEVAALPTCIAEGQTVEEVVAKTREAIIRWLERAVQHSDSQARPEKIEVDIKINMAI